MEATSSVGGCGFKSFLKLNESSKHNRNLPFLLRTENNLGLRGKRVSVSGWAMSYGLPFLLCRIAGSVAPSSSAKGLRVWAPAVSWPETCPDSKQYRGRYYEQASSSLCPSLGTAQVTVCVHYKKALPAVLALICLVSPSSLHSHIYSTQ